MPCFERKGVVFHYADRGAGVPVVFQHGLGGDTRQPASLFAEPYGFRLLTLDCRGHGQTVGRDRLGCCSFSLYADDLKACLDWLGLEKPVIGGVSMGAGVAIRFALKNPGRLSGLILSRPAWLNEPLPDNLTVFPAIAALLQAFGAARGEAQFRQSPAYQTALEGSAATAASYLHQFRRPQGETAARVLRDLPHDTPFHTLAELKAIGVPTLVLGARGDRIHPFEYAVCLAGAIPGARLAELTAKDIDPDRHWRDTHRQVRAFVQNLHSDKL